MTKLALKDNYGEHPNQGVRPGHDPNEAAGPGHHQTSQHTTDHNGPKGSSNTSCTSMTTQQSSMMTSIRTTTQQSSMTSMC